jgi:uncharacterized protein (UPF0332 family)
LRAAKKVIFCLKTFCNFASESMQTSALQNKSDILSDAAKLLYDKNLYPAVAHGAYYSCFQLMKHIWLHTMGKTEDELTSRKDSHAFLINEVGNCIKRYGKHDGNTFNNKIVQ